MVRTETGRDQKGSEEDGESPCRHIAPSQWPRRICRSLPLGKVLFSRSAPLAAARDFSLGESYHSIVSPPSFRLAVPRSLSPLGCVLHISVPFMVASRSRASCSDLIFLLLSPSPPRCTSPRPSRASWSRCSLSFFRRWCISPSLRLVPLAPQD